jgi:hypothetical protein
LKKAFPEIPPSSLFQREERFVFMTDKKILFFPLCRRGKKGDFKAFQKAKLLPKIYHPRGSNGAGA